MWLNEHDVAEASDRYWERMQEQKERAWNAYAAGNAKCAICGQRIEDDRCYVFDEYNGMETSVCMDCVGEQLRKARLSIDPMLSDLLEDAVSEYRRETPRKESA